MVTPSSMGQAKLEKKGRVSRTDVPSGIGVLRQRQNPQIGAVVWDSGEAFEAVTECSS